VREVIQTVEQVGGSPVPSTISPRRAGDPPQLVADARRAKDVLGWTPQYPDLRTIIEHAWGWHTGQ
jgi:UDP-glucose 4-epimerase